MEWKIEKDCHEVKDVEFKFARNVVSQKLIPYSFVSHFFIPDSLSLVNRTEIRKLFSENNSFGNTSSLISHVDISEINIPAA